MERGPRAPAHHHLHRVDEPVGSPIRRKRKVVKEPPRKNKFGCAECGQIPCEC